MSDDFGQIPGFIFQFFAQPTLFDIKGNDCFEQPKVTCNNYGKNDCILPKQLKTKPNIIAVKAYGIPTTWHRFSVFKPNLLLYVLISICFMKLFDVWIHFIFF